MGISAPILNAQDDILATLTIVTRPGQPTEQQLIDQLLAFVRNGAIDRREQADNGSDRFVRVKALYLPWALFAWNGSAFLADPGSALTRML
jgi:hypothetical protein